MAGGRVDPPTYMASSKLWEVVTSFFLDPRSQFLDHQRSTPNERSALRHHRVFGCGGQELSEFCHWYERLRWRLAEHESREGLNMKKGMMVLSFQHGNYDRDIPFAKRDCKRINCTARDMPSDSPSPSLSSPEPVLKRSTTSCAATRISFALQCRAIKANSSSVPSREQGSRRGTRLSAS
jgi:hypothetical protein